MFFLWFFVALWTAPESHAASMEPCDSWFTSTARPKAVVVVTHGMNLKPACMDDLARAISKAGYEVLRPAFTGHCGANEKYLKVKAEEFEADARRVHALASARAQSLKVPLHLVAYSFTAPVFQTMSEELPFDKRVYLAPAFAPKFWYPALVWLAGVFPDFTYGSQNIPECAANPKSSLRALLALDVFIQRWSAGKGRNDSAPALIIAEPEDELLSFAGLKQVADGKKEWSFLPVTNRGTTLPETFHHLIVDSASLGPGEFDRMVKEILAFFESGQSSSR